MNTLYIKTKLMLVCMVFQLETCGPIRTPKTSPRPYFSWSGNYHPFINVLPVSFKSRVQMHSICVTFQCLLFLDSIWNLWFHCQLWLHLSFASIQISVLSWTISDFSFLTWGGIRIIKRKHKNTTCFSQFKHFVASLAWYEFVFSIVNY